MDPTQLAIMDGVRVVLWWLLAAATAVLGLHFKRLGSRSAGWRLFLLIFACTVIQAAYMTVWAAHNGAVRAVGYGSLTDALYRTVIPLYHASLASFMGLLLLLAAGYRITRADLGPYRLQVIGLPILVFVTGTITGYGTFQVFESTSNDLQLFEREGWQQGVWWVCAFANLAAYGFWVVYMFEIIQLEVDAIKAQQELNLVRNAAPSATVAPFPGSFSAAAGREQQQQQQQPAEAAGGAPHAAPPPELDPGFVAMAAEEGVVAYKNLLGPGQNMSHVAGADVEAQEITTVADMVNFEVKRRLYARFSAGFGVFMVAQLCVILSPVFVIDIVQEVISFCQFVIVWAFLAVLAWIFRPADDSPYLLMSDDTHGLDTALGVDDDDEGGDDFEQQQRRTFGRANGGGVEMTAASGGVAAFGGAKRPVSAGMNGGGSSSSNGVDRDANRDQRPASASAAASLAPPVSLPAIKTSVGGAAAAAPAAAAAAAPAAHFSLGDEDELHEIQLDSARAPPPLEKRD